MTWKATVTSITSNPDPRLGMGVLVTYTDLTSSFSVNYTVGQTQDAVTFMAAEIKDELQSLATRESNSVSVSSFVGNAYSLSSSGNLQPSTF